MLRRLLLLILLLLPLVQAVPAHAQEAAANEQETADQPQTPRTPPNVLGEQRDQVIRDALRGTWIYSVGDQTLELQLREDGSFTLDGNSGEFEIVGGELLLHSERGDDRYQLQLGQSQITLTGAGGQPLVFIQRVRVSDYEGWLFKLSPAAWRAKAWRILFILLVVLAAWLVVQLLQLLSRWVIRSQRWPLCWFYRHHGRRAMTLNSLALNLVKYIIYFTALGIILTELGVNYTTYIASLSVIGLAIGFGSQGLVQDMVTGFFVIFEAQYDVGDMVDISGQTGIVEELGLRMTRLRNYMGQTVIIPNRNIAVVGNYTRGGQQVWVDVQVTAQQQTPVKELVTAIAEDVARQYRGVVLSEPTVLDVGTEDSQRKIVRMDLTIWPAQVWVVDQQILPRIRQQVKAAELEIADDRISAFYFGPRQAARSALLSSLTSWRDSDDADDAEGRVEV